MQLRAPSGHVLGTLTSHPKKSYCYFLSLMTKTHVFLFSWGDSLFVTIFASLFSIIGILLNLLVFVSVLNYRVTRRHVRFVKLKVSDCV